MADGTLIFAGVAIGSVSYILFYLGKGIQKYAIEGFKTVSAEKKKHSGIWILGTVLTGAHMFIHWIALIYAPINLIAPLEGLGLVTLLVFSYYVLHESISRRELGGVVLIIAGIGMIVGFQASGTVPDVAAVRLTLFYGLIGLLCAVEAGAVFVSSRFRWRFAGVILGTAAGTMMSFQIVCKRLTAIPDLRPAFGIAAIIFALLTLAVTQFAFVKARAGQVIPCFSSTSILLAALLGYLVLHEQIAFPQLFGFAAGVGGIILMTTR